MYDSCYVIVVVLFWFAFCLVCVFYLCVFLLFDCCLCHFVYFGLVFVVVRLYRCVFLSVLFVAFIALFGWA